MVLNQPVHLPIVATVLAVAAIVFALLPGSVSAQTAAVAEFDPETVNAGGLLFRKNCAVCHGWNAEGITADWQSRDAEGKYPPPPLNGSAHTWHHSNSVLTRIINDGTASLGGSMPAWSDKLSAQEIASILHWITSLWPDEIYETWVTRGGLTN
jgi:mono/diheme cytochrome c family protein